MEEGEHDTSYIHSISYPSKVVLKMYALTRLCENTVYRIRYAENRPISMPFADAQSKRLLQKVSF